MTSDRKATNVIVSSGTRRTPWRRRDFASRSLPIRTTTSRRLLDPTPRGTIASGTAAGGW